MATYRDDPYGEYNFIVTINGVSDAGDEVRGSFTEVSGLEVELDVIEYRNGSEEITVRKIPGLRKYPNITLKRGVIGDLRFWAWIKAALDGRVQRADGTIALLDESRNPVLTWTFRRGWPCKYSGPRLAAQGNEIAIEEIEICHEGLELE
jgi:phage tail-like protein